MAHKANISGTDQKKLFKGVNHFWNINKGVGWGYDNKWDDVLLIQYFLNSIRKANLVEDGIFGKKTQKAIKAFQKDYVADSIFADGKVNAVAGTDIWIESSSNDIYLFTIYALNNKYLYDNRVYYADLRIDPKLPLELCQILSS